MTNQKLPIRIAVLMDNAISKFQEEPKEGILKYSEETGIEAIFFGIGSLGKNDSDQGLRERFLEMITPEEFDGILLLSSSLSNSDGLDKLKKTLDHLIGLPVISIGLSIIGEESVVIDNSDGINAVMQHLLIDHQYTNFAYISGPLSNQEARERYATFREALKKKGIFFDEKGFFEGNFMTPSGQAAITSFFDERNIKPQVIVCANDLMAIGAWNGLMKRGLSVPHDIALTGFDDLQVFHSLSNQFTTIRQPFKDLGFLAAKKLHSHICGATLMQDEKLPVYLRVRTSCGCVHIEKRKNTVSAFQKTGSYQKIKQSFLAFSDAGCPIEEEAKILRLWSETIHTTLLHNNPVYELEETLRDLRLTVNGNIANGRAERVLTSLYIALLEECGQFMFMDYSKDVYSSTGLRMVIDKIHKELTNHLSLENRIQSFNDIAMVCGAKSFHVVQFTNTTESTDKASIIFSRFSEEETSVQEWAPGNRSWFPRGKGSLIANMITFEGVCFGYYLIDAAISPNKIFEDLRIRLNSLFNNYNAMKHMWELNNEMTREIQARREVERQLNEAIDRVQQMSIEDELTSLRNRRGFLTLAEQQIKYLRRENLRFCILFADLNGLKKINDIYGHKEGDLAIKSTAVILRQALRDSDIIARMGGDEFTALVSNIEKDVYPIIKQRIFDICKKKSQELGKPWQLSMCVGHFFADTECSLNIDTMLEKADEELYLEKTLYKQNLAIILEGQKTLPFFYTK